MGRCTRVPQSLLSASSSSTEQPGMDSIRAPRPRARAPWLRPARLSVTRSAAWVPVGGGYSREYHCAVPVPGSQFPFPAPPPLSEPARVCHWQPDSARACPRCTQQTKNPASYMQWRMLEGLLFLQVADSAGCTPESLGCPAAPLSRFERHIFVYQRNLGQPSQNGPEGFTPPCMPMRAMCARRAMRAAAHLAERCTVVMTPLERLRTSTRDASTVDTDNRATCSILASANSACSMLTSFATGPPGSCCISRGWSLQLGLACVVRGAIICFSPS